MRRSNGWDTTGDGHADDVSAQVSSEVSEAFEAGVQHDLTSLGLLIAEMFLRRPMVITSSRVMLAEITALPVALQPLVRSLVLQQHARRHSRPSAADLLHSTLFPRVARDAVAFLAPLHAVANVSVPAAPHFAGSRFRDHQAREAFENLKGGAMSCDFSAASHVG
jgi:hypothetical protein